MSILDLRDDLRRVRIVGVPFQVLVPSYCEITDDGVNWTTAEGMPCELYAYKPNHYGFEVLARFLLDDTDLPYRVVAAGIEVADNREDPYGAPRQPSELTLALGRLRIAGWSRTMLDVWLEVADISEEDRERARHAFDEVDIVAEIYNSAERAPVQAVEVELGLPRGTARLRIQQARERGLIAPAPGRGKRSRP